MQYIKVEDDGRIYYYKDKAMEILHREDGPAIVWPNCHKAWFINGKQLTEEEFNARTENKCCPYWQYCPYSGSKI